MAELVLDRVSKLYEGAGGAAVEDLSLVIAEGELLVLVGPSGCGKSTTLRMIAGLEEPSAGDIRISGRSVLGRAPGDRDLAMVFQNYALYPHMTVRENLAFALKMRKRPRAEIEARVAEAAEILGLKELLDRKPKQLSGGERQRVAMGRALVRHPRAFLFDEPLSNLDAKLRTVMRTEIARLHKRLAATILYVTHDQVEAMTLADRIAVMAAGRLMQVGTPAELYERPQNKFVAGFLGSPAMNFVDGRHFAKDNLIVGVRPEDLRLTSNGHALLRARVEVREPLGADAYLYLASEAGPLVVRTAAQAAAREGETVGLAVDPEKLHLFDPHTEARVSSAPEGRVS
ncbi:MAG TPA: ATP-binding cassette domain-containing protein [Polyangia bacterium]|nr:ATP-binding cassette domain-containing protein [Polyangia bacterium]